MKMNLRTNQGGSIAGFMLIGVVLVVIAVGGVYYLQNRSNSSTTAPGTTGTTDKKDEKTTKSTKKDDSPKPIGQRADNLPQSGPADTLVSIVAIAVLAGLATAYLQSLRLRLVAERPLD